MDDGVFLSCSWFPFVNSVQVRRDFTSIDSDSAFPALGRSALSAHHFYQSNIQSPLEPNHSKEQNKGKSPVPLQKPNKPNLAGLGSAGLKGIGLINRDGGTFSLSPQPFKKQQDPKNTAST